MVAILIAADDGRCYCMGKSVESVNRCVAAVGKTKDFVYIKGVESRLKYLDRAFDLIEGDGVENG